jgi:predicted Rossmann-fold nucleotide-binding protein
MQLITRREQIFQGLNGSALVVGVDLEGIEEAVLASPITGSCFLGCQASPGFRGRAEERGAAVWEGLAPFPTQMFPTRLYGVADLYGGFDPDVPDSWRDTLDHRAFRWFMDENGRKPRPLNVQEGWAARTHDTCLEASVTRFLDDDKRTVGVMGGHDELRNSESYRTVVTIARTLTRTGRVVIVTGGGPGLMEAANLGAFLAPHPDSALEEALTELGKALDFASHEWLATAARVRARLLGRWDAAEPEGSHSLGIPTWLYGHEPPNMFASHAAKFFYNSLREDGLVTVADGGLIFAPGNAGTVQEIFQDATQNYYRGADPATPMVLLDTGYWNPAEVGAVAGPEGTRPRFPKPLWPLLSQLGREKGFGDSLALTDDPEEIVALLTPEADAAPVRRPVRRVLGR